MAVVSSALPAVAATPSLPTGLVFERAVTHTPVLAAKVSDPDGGTVVGRFFARTAGASTWNLANSVQVSVPSGQVARHTLPALSAGTAVEWQVKSCETTGACSPATAIETDVVSPMLGAGPRKNATTLPFQLGDKVSAAVDVGTGNLMVTADGLAAPGVAGEIPVDMVYNSLSLGAGVPQASTTNPTGYGWTVSSTGVRLEPAADGTVVFHGPSGLTGTFVPAPGGGYVPPAGITADLEHVYGLRDEFRTASLADSYATCCVAYHSFSTSSGVRYPSAECRRL